MLLEERKGLRAAGSRGDAHDVEVVLRASFGDTGQRGGRVLRGGDFRVEPEEQEALADQVREGEGLAVERRALMGRQRPSATVRGVIVPGMRVGLGLRCRDFGCFARRGRAARGLLRARGRHHQGETEKEGGTRDGRAVDAHGRKSRRRCRGPSIRGFTRRRRKRGRPPGPAARRPSCSTTGRLGRPVAQALTFSRMWMPQALPSPITWVMPTLAPSTWRLPASPRRWVDTS